MRAHILQHVAFEGPGSIAPWLTERGWTITTQFVYQNTVFPCPKEIDLLVIMGGPMSVNDENKHPWLIEEKAFLRDFLTTNTPALGICLGAQLIASAAGACVSPNRCPEIGWFPIHGAKPKGPETFQFPQSMEAFHWHGETFEIPTGATRLASSEACTNQAFQLGKAVIGIQFHLETTPATAHSLVAHCREELQASEFVQSDRQLLNDDPIRYANLHVEMARLLEWLTARI